MRSFRPLTFCAIFTALAFAATRGPHAATVGWDGGGGNADWFAPDNWDGDAVPQSGDDVAIDGSYAVSLSNDTADLAAFAIRNGASLTFTNWSTLLQATNVTIGANGQLTHAVCNTNALVSNSNRVHIACSNLFVAATGKINADGKGYPAGLVRGQGPGAGAQYGNGATGAGHGGYGAGIGYGGGSTPYDSHTAPTEPGSGGGTRAGYTAIGHGGGAVRIDATGSVAVNGTIAVSGKNGGGGRGAGAGGSIWISCHTFTGTNGVLIAKGGSGAPKGNYIGGAGGGGRIAVLYNTTAQAGLPVPSVQLVTPTDYGFCTGTSYGDVGSLYFPDSRLLTGLTQPATYTGEWLAPGISPWNATRVTLVNSWLRIPVGGLQVHITNGLTVTGTDVNKHKLDLTNAVVVCGGSLNVTNASVILRRGATGGSDVACGGDLNLQDGAALHVYAGATNGVSPDYGARVSVTGDVTVGTDAWVYPYAHPTNGGSVKFEMDDFTIATAGSGINADQKGYVGRIGDSGYGPGGGRRYGGGGYGGMGGQAEIYLGDKYGWTYGSASAPIQPGSAGGTIYGSYDGGTGGGAVRLRARGAVTVNGTITANGQDERNGTGGGSGGGIYITCQTFAGSLNGELSANGGYVSTQPPGAPACGGAGGRIAIVYNPAAQDAMLVPRVQLSAAGGYGYYANGQLGTLYCPDSRFLTGATNAIRYKGRWAAPGFTNWSIGSLTLEDAWMTFEPDGFMLTVSNDFTMTGSGSGLNDLYALELSNALITCGGDVGVGNASLLIRGGAAGRPAVHCGGDMGLSNGADVAIYAGVTNGAEDVYGALVSVTGTLTIETNAWFYPHSHPTNGGSVLFRAGHLTVRTNAGFVADGVGFGRDASGGYGPGQGGTYSGGSYGGLGNGSSPGVTYGDSNGPALPGSAGYIHSSYTGGEGGGLIRLDVLGTLSLEDGARFSADGVDGRYWTGGGSGGAIFLRCGLFNGGQATLQALGGDHPNAPPTGYAGAGGGGRIAIRRKADAGAPAVTTDVSGGNSSYYGMAQSGTVVWGERLSVTNVGAANLAPTAADLVGQLISTGAAPTAVTCYWGTNDASNVAGAWDTNTFLGTNTVGIITNSLSGLLPGQNYYFRFYARNRHGDDWSETTTGFSTVGGPTVGNASGAADITTTSVTLRGEVIGGEPIPQAYICWGTNAVPQQSTSAWDRVEARGIQSGAFSVDITGLLANRTYYYRCYVTNANGDGWAPAVTNFTTIAPTLRIGDGAVTEGDGGTRSMSFTVSISATSAVAVTADYGTTDGTAVAPTDYLATNGTVTIAAGTTSSTVTVTILGDTDEEYPHETLLVTMSNETSAVFGDSQAVGTILNDDYARETKTWSGSGNWTDGANWSPPGAPGTTDDVIIPSGSSCLLTEPTAPLSSLVISNATLTFSNWTAEVVSDVVTLGAGALLNHPSCDTNAAPGTTNRVNVTCSNLVLEATGRINVSGRGFPAGNVSGLGPGAGKQYSSGGTGAGHGGYGAGIGYGGGSTTYGSDAAPSTPGSGGGAREGYSATGHGGGVVRIAATGRVTINGSITANGANGGGGRGAGSGGSVHIVCRTFVSVNGVVTATGGSGAPQGNYMGGGGGGGRIAVVYDQVAQSALDVPAVQLVAGTAFGYSLGGSYGDVGTLYAPDNQFLTRAVEPFTYTGQWKGPNFTNWPVQQVTLVNAWLRIPGDSLDMSVTGNLTVVGTDINLHKLEFTNAVIHCGNLNVTNATLILRQGNDRASEVACDGDMTLANGAALYVYAIRTNIAAQPYGAHLDVGGTLTVAGSSWVYPHSRPEANGSLFVEAQDVVIEANAGFNANEKGYIGYGYGSGYGPGGGGAFSGGSYGGSGNGPSPGTTYGDADAPAFPGSAGGYYQWGTPSPGGTGGGFIWVDVVDRLTLDGTLTANGQQQSNGRGGGAGGGIYLRCRRFFGDPTAVLSAKGGGQITLPPGAPGGAGGGGRIAVWRTRGAAIGADAGGGVSAHYGTAQDGTVVWRTILPGGMVFMVR